MFLVSLSQHLIVLKLKLVKSGKIFYQLKAGEEEKRLATDSRGGSRTLTRGVLFINFPWNTPTFNQTTPIFLLFNEQKGGSFEPKEPPLDPPLDRKDFFQGIPSITVVIDGGWSKRSHKHSYNAKSGVALIIGKETNKLLYLGIRNKFCSICTIAHNKSLPPKEHVCYKNWSGSSSAMEVDILLSGFNAAETMHGLRYMRVIGDGDSSVMSSIQQYVPVWGNMVTKVECANHAMKCYRIDWKRLCRIFPGTREKVA